MLPLHLDASPAITRAIRLSLFGITLAAVPTAVLLPAQVAAQTQAIYQIPAGPLGAALTQFAVQAGVTLSFDTNQTRQLTTPGLEGAYSVEEGLQRLLANSGLHAQRQANGGYVLVVASGDAVMELGATNVNARAPGAASEGTGSYITGSTSTATKLALSPRETPQSVTVVTRQQMDDQNMQSLDDVARAATGINTVKDFGTERSRYFSRGFQVDDLQFDGLPTSISESFSMDVMSVTNMAIYDRVEFVRGANGLLQGAGSPSAAVNLVRKRPTDFYQLKGELSAGSWDQYRGQLDVGGPLNQQGTLRGRTVLMYNTGNSYQDYSEKDNQLFYAIGEADLGERTTVSLGISLQQDDNGGYDWGGMPTRSNGQSYGFSRSTSFTGKWAHLDKINRSVFADIKHSFNEDWKLTLATNVIWSNADFLAQYGYHRSGDDSVLDFYANSARYDDDQISLDAALDGAFELFGRKHELVIGASARRDRLEYGTRSTAGPTTIDLDTFSGGPLPAPELLPSVSESRHLRKDKGLYLATRLNPVDDLHLIIGSRLSWADYDTAGPWDTDAFKEDAKIIPYGGVVYDLNDNHSVYASYTEIYKMQSNYSLDNKLLKPITGSNYEIGVKSEYFDGRLNTAVALFEVDQTGLPAVIADAPRQCGPTRTSRCYSEGAKVRNQGFDLEVSGELLPGWNALAGYTYSHPEYVAGPNKGKDYGTETAPQRLFKAGTTYRLPGGLQSWTVGANVYHQSRIYLDEVQQGAYNLVDLNTRYAIDKNLSVQLNLNNLFDEKYYTAVFSPDLGNYYGAPRNFALTLRYEN
ncbi:TonB-dependent siderophore receptor [Pseudomonas putida]|uniref:Ferripyoverdine receptor n=1 Tax=Pseudomonas putida TaxID=303 RepID=A0A1Q9QZ85_PSEPU|nr:TonB-dependent receptor [Pseudomonas putida]OLS60444.1 Ferripyoverdine receptor precursor [Pseudomonas putida]